MNEYIPSQQFGARGQYTLPAQAYLSPSVFDAEQDRIFSQQWICVFRESEIPNAGDFRTITVASESLIILRDHNGKIRSHVNLCRHRGTRLCLAEQGTFAKTIQCPYHGWTYGLDGKLNGVPDETCFPQFDRSQYPLHSVACTLWQGFIWINLAQSDCQSNTQPSAALDFSAYIKPIQDKVIPWQIGELVEIQKIDYQVKANWKLIVQNYSECYHCAPVHPMLTKISPPKSGGNDLTQGPIFGGYMDVITPGGSMTISGRSCGPTVGPLDPADLQRVYYYVLFPNLFLALHHDYVMVHSLWPQSPGLTTVECRWLFHPAVKSKSANELGNRELEYDPSDGIKFWDQTNREDWHVSQLTQQGVSSRRYRPGPYSDREAMSAAFDRHYLACMNDMACLKDF